MWLGLMVALKGYALFAMPAYCVSIFYRKGLPTAIKVALLCIVPFIVGNLIVLGYAGMEGMRMPYASQNDRTLGIAPMMQFSSCYRLCPSEHRRQLTYL